MDDVLMSAPLFAALDDDAAQALRVAALRETARLTRLRFNYGAAGFFEVLYAENELFAGELAAVRTNADPKDKRTDAQKSVVAGHFQWASAETQMELAEVARREQTAALWEGAIPHVMVSEAEVCWISSCSIPTANSPIASSNRSALPR